MARELLADVIGKRVLVCDGAMGTQLMARGLAPGQCGELWNVERAADVRAIHAAYVAAGCELVTTNTFGGTRTMLARHGLGERVAEINRAGAAAARAAAGDKAWVLGDVGPFGDFLEPAGDFTADQLLEIFDEQLRGLKDGGADGVIIETMVDAGEAAVAVKAARAVGEWPVIVTFSFSAAPGGKYRTITGLTAQQAVKAMIDAGATVVGTNCGTGMTLADYAALAKQFVAAAGKVPVIVQPNAGAPQMTPDGAKYLAKEDEMADLAKVLRESGVKVIGGCCGTTPGHLAAMSGALRG